MFRKGFFILGIASLFSYSIEAQSHYPGQHQDKFVLHDQLSSPIQAFDLHQIRLLDGRFKENMLREQAWIKQLDTKRLLHSFRNNAGIYSANEGGYFFIKKYGGWESLDCDLRGHSTGHLLSGLALFQLVSPIGHTQPACARFWAAKKSGLAWWKMQGTARFISSTILNMTATR